MPGAFGSLGRRFVHDFAMPAISTFFDSVIQIFWRVSSVGVQR
ncbi:MAG: hypothetical protein Q8O52_28130 [Sulfuritalea sp.]|nr:hypothetical protein [Sulfuritalea sp.]